MGVVAIPEHPTKQFGLVVRVKGWRPSAASFLSERPTLPESLLDGHQNDDTTSQR